ncbi:MAG: alpha/beta fold hydrolase [Mucilaginibacter polytrichastri]|nr:alpha/beta fold hydrolase [Mucilaginibacter polytrichastri]
MQNHILFIHGGGDDGYKTDRLMADELRNALGEAYTVHYPEIQSDEHAADFGWPEAIGKHIAGFDDDILVVAHSLGASMLLKFLSENPVPGNVKAAFLLSTPYWKGDEDWKQGLKLRKDFAEKLPVQIPLFFYHSRDDEVAPLSDLDFYRENLPQAHFAVIERGGHQLEKALALVAEDIRPVKE